jgi:hypothetical protein
MDGIAFRWLVGCALPGVRARGEDVIFGDPAVFHALVAEARSHFERARAHGQRSTSLT